MKSFFDTNVLVYAFLDIDKREAALAVLAQGGMISAQVLNEFTNVALRKYGRNWDEVAEAIIAIREHFSVIAPLTIDTHALAFDLIRRHKLSVYDALIVASAMETGCDRLYSEDLQAGQKFGQVKVLNPFA